MANRLAGETSPYLLQHADNPVDWYPWGPEALEKARSEDKPIFLSIGYAACHWCHVMAHESFENGDIAQIMNAFFVNIKVDREERPDLDGIYMEAIVAMTGQGGWPLSAFLTPDGRPFIGGTYFPPERRYNLPSFREILTYIAQAWNTERSSLLQQADQVMEHLNQTIVKGGSPRPEKELLDQAMLKLAQNYDWKFGGWGRAPKFPQPQSIEFLLRRATRGDRMALEIAEHALQAMAAGGMYDVVGGGFSRYSTDARWLVPHFEKMLYDNAQLAVVYLHAYLLTGKPAYRKICEETLAFVERELTSSEGGFFSSLDADSEGEEGKFYVWTLEEIKTILEPAGLDGLYLEAYSVSEAGNFEGYNVLQLKTSLDDLAHTARISPHEVADQLARANAMLRTARESRIRPATDDKVLAAWNGLMLTAYAEAGRYFKNKTYLKAARKNAEFLLEKMIVQGRLLRSWRHGQAHLDGYLEDYASVILGLLALYQADGDDHWYASALTLTEDMLANFSDPDGGFFDTRHDHENLILRPKSLQDNATPCGSSMAALALLQFAAYSGSYELHEKSLEMLALVQPAATQYPTAFGTWLSAIDFSTGPVQEIVLLSPDLRHERFEELLTLVNQTYRPRSVLAVSSYPPEDSAPPLVQNRSLVENLPTGFVCQNFTCQLPVNDPRLLEKQLDPQSQL